MKKEYILALNSFSLMINSVLFGHNLTIGNNFLYFNGSMAILSIIGIFFSAKIYSNERSS